MKKRIVDDIEVTESSGNVFADLALPDAAKLQIKSGLTIEINRAIQRLQLTQDQAAERMGIDFLPIRFNEPGDFSNAFATATKYGADSMFIEPSRFTLVYARRLGELAIQHRIPAISAYDTFAHAGGLLAYGARYEEQAVRAAALIDRIVNGARPADLPVEQPTRFALVVNLRTAKALGLTMPDSLLLRADEIIE